MLESDEPRGEARLLMRQDDIEQWLHPGFELAIHRDEIEGYYMNVSSGSPRVFVLWRMEDGDDAACRCRSPRATTRAGAGWTAGIRWTA